MLLVHCTLHLLGRPAGGLASDSFFYYSSSDFRDFGFPYLCKKCRVWTAENRLVNFEICTCYFCTEIGLASDRCFESWIRKPDAASGNEFRIDFAPAHAITFYHHCLQYHSVCMRAELFCTKTFSERANILYLFCGFNIYNR